MRKMLLFPVILLSGCALVAPSTPLQADANWHVDQLANGMEYHLYPTLDEEISVRLVVNIGSFQESESEKGYAHFVEHMAFNGSQHFSGNEVIKHFAQSGGSFGADINAFTSYQQTSYKLDLASEEMLNQALVWMRDISDGIQFDPAQVEKEKGVILGEWRRANPDDKSLFWNAYQASIAGTPYAEHDPIGTPESVEGATAEGLKRFYRQWYQPQNAQLVVTGNIDVEQVSELIRVQFSDWEHTSDQLVEKRRDIALNPEQWLLPSNGSESPSVHLLFDRGLIGMQTREQQHQALHDEVSLQLIQQRLQSVINDAAQPTQYVYAQASYNNYRRLASLGVAFAPQQRAHMQRLFIDSMTSLRDHGVTQDELDAILSGYQSQLSNVDNDWSKRPPASHADARVFNLEHRSVSQSQQDYKDSLQQFIERNTLSSANQSLN